MLTKLLQYVVRRNSPYVLGALVLGSALAGLLFWGAFNWAVELSSTETFCVSCHEMSWVNEEYETRTHNSNASGVRAICSDCHIPKAWGAKMMRKMRATLHELPQKILGKINTKEKFEAHRLELAEHVWDTMKANDSLSCRNCHSQEAMDLDSQDKSARKKHTAKRRLEKGETCIDCHKGIAHELPEDYEGD